MSAVKKDPADKSSAVGAPRKLSGGGRRNIYLDEPSVAEALRLSPNNISEGVRIALQLSAKNAKKGSGT